MKLIDPLAEYLKRTGDRKHGLLQFHHYFYEGIVEAKGSSHNHQNWRSGYRDHILQCLDLADSMYLSLRRQYPFINDLFALESAFVVLYLHDIEKIFKYGSGPTCVNPHPNSTPDDWFRIHLPQDYGVRLQDNELNALKYIHGEGNDYQKFQRVMCELAGFCHSVDVLSARVFHSIAEWK
jgi:hypothetical protein